MLNDVDSYTLWTLRHLRCNQNTQSSSFSKFALFNQFQKLGFNHKLFSENDGLYREQFGKGIIPTCRILFQSLSRKMFLKLYDYI